MDLEIGNYLYDETDMRGGDDITLTVTCTTKVDNKVYSTNPIETKNPFIIKGQNPTRETLVAELKEDLYAAIAWNESTFRQFGSDGYPLQGGRDKWDFGLMQIRNPSKDEIIWDWTVNLKTGKDYLDKCIEKAKVYNERIDKEHIWDGTDVNKPALLNNNPTSTDPNQNQVFLQAYCYYNNGYYGNARYWRWIKGDPKLEDPGRWIKETENWIKVVEHADNVWDAFVHKSWNKE